VAIIEEAGFSVFERLDRIVRQFLCAERGIGRAADVVAACHRDHVMQTRDAFLQDRERGAEGRMGVDDGIDVIPVVDDVQMKPPFRRRHQITLIGAVRMHEDDVTGLHRLIRTPRRRDQHTAFHPRGNVTRGALIDAGFVHFQTGIDDRLT